MNFHTEWTSVDKEPFLLIMTHEDSAGKVYGSVSTMIMYDDGRSTSDVEDLKDGYMKKLCSSLLANSFSSNTW